RRRRRRRTWFRRRPRVCRCARPSSAAPTASTTISTGDRIYRASRSPTRRATSCTGSERSLLDEQLGGLLGEQLGERVVDGVAALDTLLVVLAQRGELLRRAR